MAEALSPFDPFLASVQITRAMALLQLGRVDEAGDWASRAARHGTAYAQLRCHAAVVLAVAERDGEARQMLAALRQAFPGYSGQTLRRSLYGFSETMVATLQTAARRIGLETG